MKKVILFTMLFLGTQQAIAESQSPFMTQDMQGLMQKMQGIQECMAKIDQSALNTMAEKSKQVHDKIVAQCDKGDKSGAEKTAMDFANEMKASPEVQQVQACAKDLPDMMQGHMQMLDVEGLQKQYADKDICTEIKNKK